MCQIVLIDRSGNADAYAAGDPTPGVGANEFATRRDAEDAIPYLDAPGEGDDPPPTLAEQVRRRRELELAPRCPHCGEPAPHGTITVTYDPQYDGPGADESEERCDQCLESSP